MTSEGYTSSLESASSTATNATLTISTNKDRRHAAGAESESCSRQDRSRSVSLNSNDPSRRKRRSRHSLDSRRSEHPKSRSHQYSTSSRSHKFRHRSTSSRQNRHSSESRRRSRQSKPSYASRNSLEHTIPQQQSLSCCSSFGIVVQTGLLMLGFFYTIFSYYNAHSSILYVTSVFTASQGGLWLILMLCNCIVALHGALISFMCVTFMGFVELGFFMFSTISDANSKCDRFGCAIMHGVFEHRLGIVAMLVIAFVVHTVYSFVYICESISQWKEFENVVAKQQENATKERIIVAPVRRHYPVKASRSSKVEKSKKSPKSVKDGSSVRSRRSVQSEVTVATSIPSTTSMISFVPQQEPIATQPLVKLPSHESVQSGYGQQCPVDAQQCTIPTCPYFSQNQKLIRQLSNWQQNSVSLRQALQPTLRKEIASDQSCSITIDMPQAQPQPIANNNNSLQGFGYRDNLVDVQRVVVNIQPQQRLSSQPQ